MTVGASFPCNAINTKSICFVAVLSFVSAIFSMCFSAEKNIRSFCLIRQQETHCKLLRSSILSSVLIVFDKLFGGIESTSATFEISRLSLFLLSLFFVEEA